MSEYKWSDPDSWDTFCYVKKGEEKLGFFQTYLELEALERQLAEARELIFSAYQEGWNDNRNNFDSWETHWIDSDSRYSLEQLKEQGDE